MILLGALAVAWLFCFALLARACRSEASDRTALPLGAFIWLWCGLGFIVVSLAAGERIWPLDRALERIGPVLFLAGFGIVAMSFVEFGSVSRITGAAPVELVASGVHSVSRHPQYLGLTIAATGVAMIGSSGFALVLTAVQVLALWPLARAEERALVRELGEPYRRYRAATPAIIGPPPRSRPVDAARGSRPRSPGGS